jgi:iron-sulfur cluster repair protein YtfE (RIC family)
MARPTEEFHEEHSELMEHVEHLRATARELPDLPEDERAARLERILEFLRGVLLPHAQAEEEHLYPRVAEILGDPRATGTMLREHVAIHRGIESLAATDPGDTLGLQELLFGLNALIRAHFDEEEEVYLPILDTLPEDELRELFARMGEASGHAHH